MNTAITITLIICITIVVIGIVSEVGKNNQIQNLSGK